MEFKHLRHFMRVARAGSVSRAAQELRLAQPALSRQIRQLERELGVSLFSRHGRGVRLSPAGSLLLERAEAIAHLVHQTREEIKEDRAAEGGRVVLGVPPAAGRILTPPFVARFQQAWPKTALHMVEGVTSSLQEWLLEKRLDIAILHNPPHLELLDITPILTERMMVIGPPVRGKAQARQFRIRDFADLPLILPSMAHNNRRLVENAAMEHGVQLRIKTEVDSVAFAKAMVEEGLGYTILTYAAVQDEVKRHRLCAYPIARPALLTMVNAVRLRGQPPVPHIAGAFDILRDICRELVRDGGWVGTKLC
jgi:LysR family nitrogen assimilation transcriptional regulator